MKMDEARQLMAGVILEKGKTSPAEISYSTKIPLIQVYKIAKDMADQNIIAIEEGENSKLYTVKHKERLEALRNDDLYLGIGTGPEDTYQPTRESEQKQEPETRKRHTSKYIYNKVAYSKSLCVFMVVADFVKDKKPTLKELKEAFPDEIVSRFGVVNTLKEAKELSGKTPRYYMKDDQVLTTSDSKKVVVTTQWTLERFLNFKEAAARVGYKVEEE